MTSKHPVVFLTRRIAFALVAAAVLGLGCDSGHSLGSALGAGGGTTGAAGSTSATAGRGGAGGGVAGAGGGAAGAGGGVAGGGAAGADGGVAGAGGGQAAGTGGGAAGVGGAPACSDDVPCSGGLFCKRDPSSACTAGIVAGHCVEPEPCPANIELVCGCDGRTYSNDCIRRSSGVGPDTSNACFGTGGTGGRGGGGGGTGGRGGSGGGTAGGGGGGTAGGTGGATSCADCNPTTQYCRNIVGGSLGSTVRFQGCSPLPTSCSATPTCACLTTEACSLNCSTMSGVLAVVCQVP